MPIHRETLIAYDELEDAQARLEEALQDVKVEVRERDVERSLERLDELRRRADELEETLLRVRR